jgi:cell division protein FtsA
MAAPRISRVVGAVNMGSFRISAMIAGIAEDGSVVVLGSGHRAAEGIRRGYVADMAAATFAVRDAIERAEKMANTSVSSVLIGCSGAGLASRIVQRDIEVGGGRIEQENIEQLLLAANDSIQHDGRIVLHAQPAHYWLDGAHGVANPRGLHAERLGVDIHVMLADGAPVRNLTESVQNAHLDIDAVVASPVAAGYACLTPEERDLGVALVEYGAEVTNVAVFMGGMLVGLCSIPNGSGDVTDAIASAFGIRRFQAERLKCVHGSAIASPADHREMIPVNAPGEEAVGPAAFHADDKNRIPRAELVTVITDRLARLMGEIDKALKSMGFSGSRSQMVVLTGGGAELTGLADYAQSALGRPVRIGKPLAIQGLAEAHAVPSFTTVAGLVLYAAADPIDIRSVGPAWQQTHRYSGLGLVTRVIHAVKAYF